MPDPIILIHGAWQGSWTFDALLPALEAVELVGFAIDLPGNGVDNTRPEDVTLDVYLDFLEAQIDDVGGRACVVGHSGAGLIATALAERSPERVSSVIYLAGMCLPNGEDFGQLQARVDEPVGISDDIIAAPDGLTSTVPIDKAIHYFLNDCDPDVARAAAERLRPQPEGGRFITSPTTAENFGPIPKLYIEALRDISITIGTQRAMQQLAPDLEVVSVDTGHVPQLMDPQGVAAAMGDFIHQLETA